MIAGRVPGSAMTALLASEWVTGSAAVWITAGIVAAAVLALGIVYRERPETWMFGRADDGRAPADTVDVPRGEE